MKPPSLLPLAALTTIIRAQKIGTWEPEVHPRLPIQSCSPNTPCATLNTSLVLDAEWRWLHNKDGVLNCYDWGDWNKTLCPDGATCAANCALEGATYDRVYGVKIKEANLSMEYVTKFDYSQNYASRLFVLEEGSEDRYKMWRVLNREVAFEVDVSRVPCGIGANVYFVGMDADGGMGREGNRAGARYGTGYCDAGCRRNMRFVGGEANVKDWIPNPIRDFVGTGRYGTCCPEVALWNANSLSTSLSAHPCTIGRQTRCEGLDCEDTLCDRAGCDLNPYRLGDRDFYGVGKKVDTSKKFTVVTQFVTDTGTDAGTLVEIRRKYIQNGVVLEDSSGGLPSIPSAPHTSGISDSYCRRQKKAFGERDVFTEKGGMARISEVLAQGMVLAFAITEDQEGHMLWLDSNWPIDADPQAPGVARGACANDTGDPINVGWEGARAKASYADIRVGWIGMSEAAVKG